MLVELILYLVDNVVKLCSRWIYETCAMTGLSFQKIASDGEELES